MQEFFNDGVKIKFFKLGQIILRQSYLTDSICCANFLKILGKVTMPHYRLNNIKMPLDADNKQVLSFAQSVIVAKPGISAVEYLKIVKKSLDARHKDKLVFVYAVEFDCASELACSADLMRIDVEEKLDFVNLKTCFKMRPVVIGAGPAGMMAALALAEAGANPIVIERGAPVDERKRAVDKFWQTGVLDETTNVQFGEGGAGTFSDGKLMTGIKKDKFTAKVLHEFALAGAPQEILYLSKPHIGTDKLLLMTENLRRKIISLGGEYRFYEQLVDLEINDGVLSAAIIRKKDGSTYRLATDKLFLALGHSARDTFEMLYNKGLEMTQKPFAVGVRIEHKQSDVNLAQYGRKFCHSPYLGAADYKLAVHLPDNRSVYTFCMCPGGTVVAATSLAGHVVTNGMSEFLRNKENANAALLVNVDERDFGSLHPLAGMYFQEELEKKAFTLGGENYFAPVQTVGDFLASRASVKLGSVIPSYRPGVTPADFKKLFSKELCEALKEGIRQMDKKLRGFASPDAVLTAVESRSSSPVRLVRGADFQSNVKGIFPIGEGAGYAGGITSAAADALKCVQNLSI